MTITWMYIYPTRSEVDLNAPVPGLWEALHTHNYETESLAKITVTRDMLATWPRLCLIELRHRVPGSIYPTVRKWIETGDESLREEAQEVAWKEWVYGNGERWGAWLVFLAAQEKRQVDWKVAAWRIRLTIPNFNPTTVLLKLIWEEHGKTMANENERLALGRKLRYIDEVAGNAVVPPQYRTSR